MVYKGKKILVCGMGLSGVAAARLVLANGGHVTLCDLRDEPQIPADLLTHEAVETCFGKNPDDAILKEHQMMVLSPGIATDLPFVEAAYALKMPILSEMELAARHCAASIIGVTGTNGKTTVCSLTADIMRLAHPNTALVGNIGIPFAAQAENLKTDDWVVAEVSSFQLETIVYFRPKISSVLNMTPDHLNRHKTMDAYIAAKARIFENQDADDFCVLNYDNQHSYDMAAKTSAKVLFFSLSTELDEGVFVKNDTIWVKWESFNDEIIKLSEIPIPGSHNVENVMAAAALTLLAGVSLENIANGIKNFKAVEHRLEFVTKIDGTSYYNDSKATNVDSAIKAIDAIVALNLPIILIGGGLDKGLDYNELVKKFTPNVKLFIVLGETADEMINTCKAHNFTNFEKVATLKDAVNLAASRAENGDVVLLSPACAALDMFDNYEQRGKIFKQFVMEMR